MASLLEVTTFVLCTTVACLQVSKPFLDFLQGIFPCSPVLVSAAVLLTLCTTYLTGVTLVFLQVSKPFLDFLQGIFPCSPVLVSAAVLLTLCTTYLTGVTLVFLQANPVLAALVPPEAIRRLAGLACAMASALLLLLAMPLVAFQFLTAGM